MAVNRFKPHPRYLIKLLIVITLIAALVLVGGMLLGWLISLDDRQASVTVAIVVLAANALWWVPAMILSVPYYRSMQYEIQEDEVIVRVGIFTHSVKHVPYRTVTNLTVKRDILDRWFFNLGSLQIQTAGMSGQTGAEEKLAGLENVQEVYEMVAASLRRFRGGMAPTGAGEELPERSDEAPGDLLAEVRAIRQLLEKSES